MTLSSPEPMDGSHNAADFDSGVPSLDDWLRRRALTNQTSGASRTFVVCSERKIAAYYALAAGGVSVFDAPGRFRRNMPDPVPVVILGRLAVDKTFHGRGIGRGLVRDAGLRIIHSAQSIGVRGILVHALSESAKAFYLSLGFETSPLDPMTLMITLGDLRDSV